VFVGTYLLRLDEKGRLAVPAKYREALAGGVVVTAGQEHCLYLFDPEAFVRWTQALRDAPLSSGEARMASRMIGAQAHDDVPDKQGRITLPAPLRQYAGLGRDVAVIGSISRLEVWDVERWQAYHQQHEQEFAEMNKEVMSSVF
jgi:MraZ protein